MQSIIQRLYVYINRIFSEIPVRENNRQYTCGCNGKSKSIRLHPFSDSLNDLLSTSQCQKIKKNLQNTSGTMGKKILQFITDVSALLSQITAYGEKNIKLKLQAQRDSYHYCLHLIFKIIHDTLPLITFN